MKLNGRTLDAWFKTMAGKNEGDLRERGSEYRTQYENAATQLTKYVHSQVTQGAIAKDGGFLTDHGPDHIRKVILRAGEIVDSTNCELTMYETYVLLMAIHFHDVGNAFGRKKHEQEARKAMDWLGTAGSRERIERNTILQIARAHGGDINGEKDTIAPLPLEAKLLNFKIRPRLLAAIVRFADELADDRDRASRFMVETGAIPDTALIYHQYATALHSVHVDHGGSCIHLEFEFDEEIALKNFKHPRGGETYLLDYIFERTAKMHTERLYCMRFLRPHGIGLDSVLVQVSVYGQSLEPVEKIGYRLTESGYPPTSAGIYDICPELANKAEWNCKVTGVALAERLKGDHSNG